MNILAIVGSPRKGGNTDILVDHVIQGARSQGREVNVERIYINDLKLQPCQGDLSCRTTGKCTISDDMIGVLERVKQADALVLGSPLYRGYLPGQMKVLMDRTSPLEKDVDVEQMRKSGKSMRIMMSLFAKIIPQRIQIMMMKKMTERMGHLYRLEGKKNSVVVVVGAHPSYMPVMKRDLERTAEELGSFSFMSGGSVVSSILVSGVSKKGEILEKKEFLGKAFEAGRQLVAS